MPIFRRSDLARFWPRAHPDWLTSFVSLHETLGERYGVNTPQRWRHFLAQTSCETDGLNCSGKGGACEPGMRENMRYRPASLLSANGYRVRKAQRDIPRFQRMTLQEVAQALCADPTLLAETVYGSRPELGNTQPGDGAKFIGRGPLQTTGREAYKLVADRINVDCVSKPELLEQPRYGWEASFCEWAHLGCNELADQGNVDKVSRRVNGGTNGLAERRAWLTKAEAIWPDEVFHDVEPDALPDAEPPKPRDEATTSDVISMGSRTAKNADLATKTGTAIAAAGAVGTVAEQLQSVTDSIDAFKGVGEAIHTFITFGKNHVFIVLLIAGVLAAYFGRRILTLVVENFRHGRYEPSGR